MGGRIQSLELTGLLESLENGGRPKGGVGNITAGIPSIGGEHVTRTGGFDFGEMRFVPEDYFRAMKRGRVKAYDILLVKDGATTGKVAFVDEDFPFAEAAVNEHVFIVRALKNKILPKYLFFFLYSSIGQSQILANFHGAAQGGINTTFAQNVFVPTPSIEIQRRIVQVLEKAYTLRKKRDQANQLTNKIILSVFLKMFGDPLTNPRNWKIQRIREFCKMGTGGTPRRSTQSYYGGSIPWVKSGEVNLRYIDDTEEKLTESGFNNSNAKFLPSNTILVAMYGATAGKVALLRIKATTNQAVCSLMPDPKVAHYSYLQHCLEFLAPRLVSRTVGTGQPNLSQEIIGDVEVPIPDVDMQRKFAGIVDGSLHLQKQQRESASEIQMLFRSLMHKAFRGELRLGTAQLRQEPQTVPTNLNAFPKLGRDARSH